jgi:hypothetical protein
MKGIPAPSSSILQKYGVNLPGKVEVIWEPLYHYVTYPAAGAQIFTFFQNPLGQGGNTLSDTNMRSAGQIPKGQQFVITSVQVELFLDGDDIQDAGDPDQYLRDYHNVMTGSANLQLEIGSKDYLQQGPLNKFPPVQNVDASIALGTGNAALEGSSYAVGGGNTFNIVPVTLTSNQNFSVTINFDTAIAINADARFGVTLNGYKFRNAQ